MSEERCIIINEVLESNFFISKQSKNKIIDELVKELDIDFAEAEMVYLRAVDIMRSEVKKVNLPLEKN